MGRNNTVVSIILFTCGIFIAVSFMRARWFLLVFGALKSVAYTRPNFGDTLSCSEVTVPSPYEERSILLSCSFPFPLTLNKLLFEAMLRSSSFEVGIERQIRIRKQCKQAYLIGHSSTSNGGCTGEET